MNVVGLGSQLVYYSLWIGLVVGLAELLRRREVDSEITRKIVHIGVGNSIVLAWILQMPRMIGIGASVVAACVALISYQIDLFQSVNGVGRHSFGTFFYAISIGLLIALFWFPEQGLQPFAVVGILVMTWGDALAALVGQTWGRHPYQLGSIQKSWEGSVTMALVSVVVTMVVLGAAFGWSSAIGWVAVLTGVTAAVLEILSWRGVDNVTVPLASGVLSYWLSGWLG